MIVYGDPSFSISAGEMLDRLRSMVRESLPADGRAEDWVRDLLVEAGQLEQGLADAMPQGCDELEIIMRVTDAAARALIHRSKARDELAVAARELGQLRFDSSLKLKVKTPEGFAFYALYPEQYVAATRLWTADHQGNAAGVVGIRSIGTSLSAVVKATLEARGCPARRWTVRPHGHPYHRICDLPAHVGAGAEQWIVTDEGPGRSGSSMASVAQALAERGVDPIRISFLPGHGSEPGDDATETVRAWWSRAKRYVVRLDQARWDGLDLREKLAAATRAMFGENVGRVVDMGGGLWRRIIYPDAQDWPAACAPFERTKYRIETEAGPIVWKFHGLGRAAHAAHHLLSHRARRGWHPAPLGVAMGFVGTPWIEGTPMRACDLTKSVAGQIGRYIADVAGEEMPIEQVRQGISRLAEMLYWNVREDLGEDAAAKTRRRCDAAMKSAMTCRRFGDGRMMPHEWLRDAQRTLKKVPGIGHDADHTMVGPQPVCWDAAGAIVEWEMDRSCAAALLDAVGDAIHPEMLAFYLAAYAAFRLGQCRSCEGMAGDDRERRRLRDSVEAYRRRLRGGLER